MAEKAFGTLLKRGDGESSETFTAIAQITNLSNSMSGETADVTHMQSSSGFREFIGTLRDAGEISIDCNFLPNDTGHQALIETDFATGVVRNFQVVFASTVAKTWAVSGIVTGFSWDAPVDGKLGGSFTIKLSGLPTWTVA